MSGQPEDMMEGVTHYTNKGEPVQIIKYVSCYEVLIKSATTGWEGTVRSDQLRLGQVKDPLYPNVYGFGYLGEGKFSSRINGKLTPAYAKWRGMLKRCYYPKYHYYHRYGGRGVYVASEWCNYQVFAQWYEESCQSLGIPLQNDLHLDKDILSVDGDTPYYGPDTCCLISARENSQESNSKPYQFRDKYGLIHSGTNRADFARCHGLDQGALSRLQNGESKSHKGWTFPQPAA